MEDDTEDEVDPEMKAPWSDPYNKSAFKEAGRSGSIPANEDTYMQDEDINDEESQDLYQRELYPPHQPSARCSRSSRDPDLQR